VVIDLDPITGRKKRSPGDDFRPFFTNKGLVIAISDRIRDQFR